MIIKLTNVATAAASAHPPPFVSTATVRSAFRSRKSLVYNIIRLCFTLIVLIWRYVRTIVIAAIAVV